MIEQISDVNHWLETNGIKRKWADAVVGQIMKQYPHLGRSMKNNRTNRAELDLVLLVHHTMEGRFPVKSEDRKPV